MNALRIFSALLAATLAVACDSGNALDGPSAVAQLNEREVLRDHVRLVLEAQCGDCHISQYPTAIPAALDVYDLTQVEWAATMSIAQLEDAKGRLDTPLPEDGPQVTALDLERFQRFIELEKLRRAPVAAEETAPCI